MALLVPASIRRVEESASLVTAIFGVDVVVVAVVFTVVVTVVVVVIVVVVVADGCAYGSCCGSSCGSCSWFLLFLFFLSPFLS